MSVSCECFALSGRRLSDVPIPRPEELYRLWCVIECDRVQFVLSTPAVGYVEEVRQKKF